MFPSYLISRSWNTTFFETQILLLPLGHMGNLLEGEFDLCT